MRYQALPADLYTRNRSNFMKEMKPRSIAVFFSNDIYPTSADGTMPFKQASDIFWLTGVDQEEAVLLVFPDAHNPADREILFTLETNKELAIWEGAKLDKSQAKTQTGIGQIQWVAAFEKTLQRLMAEADALYLNDNPHTRASKVVQTRTDRENAALRATYPNFEIERSAPILFTLRALKSQEEIEQMQRACDITKAGFERVLQFVKPGVMEYEIEAEFMHEFLRRGSRGFAYTPIIGSGFNACVLHYIENSMECKAGDVILMDVGAEYGNYTADMTRCVPVSGKFTDRQRDVYNAVLAGHAWGDDLVAAGRQFTGVSRGSGCTHDQGINRSRTDHSGRSGQRESCLAGLQKVLHARDLSFHWTRCARRRPLAQTH